MEDIQFLFTCKTSFLDWIKERNVYWNYFLINPNHEIDAIVHEDQVVFDEESMPDDVMSVAELDES